MELRVLFQDEHLIAVDKPSGLDVHSPESSRSSSSPSHRRNCLFLLKRQSGRYLYPVHRLDRATSGVLLFALSPEAARGVSKMFREREIEKTYYAVVRGWPEDEGVIDSPLRSDSSGELRPALTRYRTLARLELPHAVGRYPSARFSVVEVRPETGRMHQIRRHFAHIRHPLIGDSVYGDTRQNRFFREVLSIQGLLLKAQELELSHPESGEWLSIRSRWSGKWHRIFDLFGICPFNSSSSGRRASSGSRKPGARPAG